jgi:hypothetical protein
MIYDVAEVPSVKEILEALKKDRGLTPGGVTEAAVPTRALPCSKREFLSV